MASNAQAEQAFHEAEREQKPDSLEGEPSEPITSQDAVILALQETPETKNILDVMGAVLYQPAASSQDPSNPGQSAGVPTTFKVPKGSDFYITLLTTIGVGLFFAYMISTGIAFVWALINMMMKQCGQEHWKTDGDTACNAKLINALVLSIELRCFESKPAAMPQEDFDEVCSGYWMDCAGTGCFFLVAIVSILYTELGKVAYKVTFHESLFVVESWHGKLLECSFFSDVVAAKTSSFGLEVTTKARVRTGKGGCDPDGSHFWESLGLERLFGSGKKEKTLRIHGDAAISVLAGDGAPRRAFLQEFAKRLPVSIQGFDGVAVVAEPEAAVLATSLLDGRLGNILRARRGEGEPERVRKPISCDLYTEVLFIVLMVAIGCYCLAVLMNIFGWAMATGRGKCTHDMKPGVDLCDFVRVFSPIELPLVTVQEYVNVGIFVATCAVYPLWTFMNMPFEYRFHQKDVVEEVLFAGWQSQASTMVVQGDIEAMEMVWGTMEKYIRATVRAIYTVKQGIAKPFEVTARFAQMDMKIGLVDNDCASCSGHRAKALSYKESIVRALNETKPGHLPLPEAEAEA